MRLRLSKFAKMRIPFDDEAIPLKTSDKIEQHLQRGVSFLQAQREVLARILGILEEVYRMIPRNGSGQSQSDPNTEATISRFRDLQIELQWLGTLEFNDRTLFSSDESVRSFKLFRTASRNVPRIKRFPILLRLDHISECNSYEELSDGELREGLNAMNEMIGQNTAAENDLRNCFTALAGESPVDQDLHFSEQKTKSWVAEIMERSNALVAQAHLDADQLQRLLHESSS
jgi:hypothetical protein